jgi:hypothetical protein
VSKPSVNTVGRSERLARFCVLAVSVPQMGEALRRKVPSILRTELKGVNATYRRRRDALVRLPVRGR